ncbi:12625_t:CDS:2 [Ambispora gerdemannii]|uniref:12625_t:CDS:1 n=1 Tax=Ambispora gerdemannii TaxID=144530 RepID=A0A9N9AZ34_9GLOM|nr:12625_t:CDS:2 [Ambispora gerdemannii]
MYYLDLCNRDLAGEMDLKDFTNLKSLNASNNKFENLDFLNSLPNKDKLQSINLFGNEIQNLDLNLLLADFPNLKVVNLDNNPLSLKNLEQLSVKQLNSLVDMELKEKTNQSTNNSHNSQTSQQTSVANYQSIGKDNKNGNNLLLLPFMKIINNEKFPPIHPGEILLENFFKPRNLTIEQVAQDIKVPFYQLQDLIAEKRNIDTDMAYRLGYYFKVGAEGFLNLQQHYDLEC